MIRVARRDGRLRPGEADRIRRASRRRRARSQDPRPDFLRRAVERGVPAATAERIWKVLAVRLVRVLQGPCRRVRRADLPVGVAEGPLAGPLPRRGPHPRARHVPPPPDPRGRPAPRHRDPAPGRQPRASESYTVRDGSTRPEARLRHPAGAAGRPRISEAEIRSILEARAERPFVDVGDVLRRTRLAGRWPRRWPMPGRSTRCRGGGSRRDRLYVAMTAEAPRKGEQVALPLDGRRPRPSFGSTRAERVRAELEVVRTRRLAAPACSSTEPLLRGPGRDPGRDLGTCGASSWVMVAGVKVASQTPAVRSGQRIIFLTLDDGTGLADVHGVRARPALVREDGVPGFLLAVWGRSAEPACGGRVSSPNAGTWPLSRGRRGGSSSAPNGRPGTRSESGRAARGRPAVTCAPAPTEGSGPRSSRGAHVAAPRTSQGHGTSRPDGPGAPRLTTRTSDTCRRERNRKPRAGARARPPARAHPARRPRRVLRLGRGPEGPHARRQARRGREPHGVRGVVMSASYEARAAGLRSAMPEPAGSPALPAGGVRPAGLRGVPGVLEPVPGDPALLHAERGADLARRGVPRRGGRHPPVRPAPRDRRTDPGRGPRRARAHLLGRRRADQVPGQAGLGPRPSPTACIVVPASEVRAFLHPLPVGALWGVGEKTAATLARLGHPDGRPSWPRTPEVILRRVPRRGTRPGSSTWPAGRDDRPVVPFEAPKSVSHEETFARDLDSRDEILRELLGLSARVGGRLRADGYRARTVTVKVRLPSFSTLTRSRTLPAPTDVAADVFRRGPRAVPGPPRRPARGSGSWAWRPRAGPGRGPAGGPGRGRAVGRRRAGPRPGDQRFGDVAPPGDPAPPGPGGPGRPTDP